MFDDPLFDDSVVPSDYLEDPSTGSEAEYAPGSTTQRDSTLELLSGIEPSPAWAAGVASIDPEQVTGLGLGLLLHLQQRAISHLTSKLYATINAISDEFAEIDGDAELADEAASMEVRTALRLTRRMADREMRMANHLHHRLPHVGAALASGRIDARRARVIADGTTHLPQQEARSVAEKSLVSAHRLTTGQLAANVRRLCFDVDPEQAKSRYEAVVGDRRLVSEPTDDGTAGLHLLDIAPDAAARAFDTVDRIARSLKSADETRSLDQLRADVAVDLLTGSSVAERGGTIDLIVDLRTLAGLAESPGDLGGYGPVIADIARQVTARQQSAEWRWTAVDTETEQVVANGTTRRRPTAAMRREVEARDRTCVFPGCRAPATRSDLDHMDPWAHSHHTSPENLGPLCRSDHVKYHRHGWAYERLPNGDYRWFSRLGGIYTTSGLPPPQLE